VSGNKETSLGKNPGFKPASPARTKGTQGQNACWKRQEKEVGGSIPERHTTAVGKKQGRKKASKRQRLKKREDRFSDLKIHKRRGSDQRAQEKTSREKREWGKKRV